MTESDPYDYGADAGAGFDASNAPTPRDIANVLLEPLNLDLQLAAIRSMLQRNRAAEVQLGEEVRELEDHARRSTGWNNERAEDEHGEAIFRSIYEGGTNSLAAIAMLAPLTETVLVRLLNVARKLVDVTSLRPLHARWCANGTDEKRWSCKYRWDKKTKQWEDDIIGGINQFVAALKDETLLTSADRKHLDALFQYRNNMLHNGMEWPELTRSKFQRQVDRMPPGWFSAATSDDRPSMFYMTEQFVHATLDLLERFVDAVGVAVLAQDERRVLLLEDLRR